MCTPVDRATDAAQNSLPGKPLPSGLLKTDKCIDKRIHLIGRKTRAQQFHDQRYSHFGIQPKKRRWNGQVTMTVPGLVRQFPDQLVVKAFRAAVLPAVKQKPERPALRQAGKKRIPVRKTERRGPVQQHASRTGRHRGKKFFLGRVVIVQVGQGRVRQLGNLSHGGFPETLFEKGRPCGAEDSRPCAIACMFHFRQTKIARSAGSGNTNLWL